MPSLSKAFIVSVVSAVTFALGAAPAAAAPQVEDFAASAAFIPAANVAQTLRTPTTSVEDLALETMLQVSDAAGIPHRFDVAATIAQATSEIGTSRPTGWSQPGECIMSAQRWVRAGGGLWTGGGNPVSNYDAAERLTILDAQPGDIVQYEHLTSPTSWVSGVHTVLITEVHDDGTFTIIESNNPGGSGLVSKDEKWKPAPPAGFQAVVWRF